MRGPSMMVRQISLRMTGLLVSSLAFWAGSIAWADLILPGDARLRNVERMVLVTDPKSPIVKAIETAQASLGKRDIKAARESLQSLATDPNVAHPEILLAELLTAAGFTADARTVLEELSGKEPQRIDVYLAFCELAVREQRWFDGWNLANIGERGSAPEHWSPAFRQQISDRLRMLKGVCCEGRKDWQGAQEIYTPLAQLKTTAGEALAGLGRTSFHQGNVDAALGYFEKLKQLKPESDPPQLRLAQLYDLTGKSAEAEAAYQQALQSAAGLDAVKVRLSFARWLIINNRPRPTTALLADAIQDSPENETERQFLQALVARMEGRLADAQKILSLLHQQNPESFVIGNQLALVLCQSTDEALRARSLQIAEVNTRNLPKSSEAWATLGWIQLQLGDRSTAEQSLANATQLGPMSRDTLYYLWQFKRTTDDTKATELLDKAFRDAKGPNYFARPTPAAKQ